MHSCLLYYKGGVKYLLVKALLKKLFLVLSGLLLLIVVISIFNVSTGKKALQKEIIALNEEYNRMSRELSELENQYNSLTYIFNEQENIRSIITSVNPWLENEHISLWVKTLKQNVDNIFQSLNDHSLYKLKSEKSQNSLNPGISLLLSVAAIESDFNVDSRSRKGAYGPMQLRKTTAQHVGVINRQIPEDNINGGVKYLNDLLNKYYDYPDQLELALASYNAGRARVLNEWISNWGSNWVDIKSGLYLDGGSYRETRNYVNSILAMTHLFVTGKWSEQNQNFWSSYKYYARNKDIAFLYDNIVGSENFR